MREMIDHTISLEPVDGSKYSYPKTYPAVYYGANIKHQYDSDRLNINKGHRIKHEIESIVDGVPDMKYIYGIPVENPLLILKLYKDLQPSNIPRNKLLEVYFKHLSKYQLTCSDSYGYIDVGCLTIDGAHLNEISENTEYNIFDVNEDDPQWYSRYASTHIFILYK